MTRVPLGARRLARITATAAVVLLAVVSRAARAQVSPNLDWRTIRTTHFYVHFAPPTEGLARRIAADA